MRFDSFHPAVNFIFFASVLAAAVLFDQPVYLALSFLCAAAYSILLGKKGALCFDLAVLLLSVVFACIYARFEHFGMTYLHTFAEGNHLTLEALLYGWTLALRAGAVLIWLSCMHRVISSDKVVYLFGRAVPRLSLFLSILLRMVPRIRAYGKKVNNAQRAIGRGMDQGNIFRRIRNFFRIASIVITWMTEQFITISDSMRSRGYALKGRSAYSNFRFDGRDRSFLLAWFACFALTVMAVLLDQTRSIYDPQIILNRITLWSVLFYLAYALLCLLPMLVQMRSETSYARKVRQLQ